MFKKWTRSKERAVESQKSEGQKDRGIILLQKGNLGDQRVIASSKHSDSLMISIVYGENTRSEIENSGVSRFDRGWSETRETLHNWCHT